MNLIKTVWMMALGGGLMSGVAYGGGTPADGEPQASQNAPKMPLQVGMYRVQKSLTMNVMIEKKLGDRVEIHLIDQRGNVLYENVMGRRQQKSGYKLDFSGIQDGTYSVIVTNGTQEISKEISLSTFRLYEMPTRNLVTVN